MNAVVSLDELVQGLAEARKVEQEAEEKNRLAHEKLSETMEAKEAASALMSLKVARETLEWATMRVRDAATQTYLLTGEKHPHEAVEVKLFKSVTVPDEGAAIRWCVTNFTPALMLNKKVFETAVKSGSIPSELAAAIDEARVYIKAELENITKE